MVDIEKVAAAYDEYCKLYNHTPRQVDDYAPVINFGIYFGLRIDIPRGITINSTIVQTSAQKGRGL